MHQSHELVGQQSRTPTPPERHSVTNLDRHTPTKRPMHADTAYGRHPVALATRGSVPLNPRQAGVFRKIGNDPSAGSPTETLLRLLLPLNHQVRSTSAMPTATHEGIAEGVPPETSLNNPSVVATGGVYKGQGRNQR